MHMTAYTERAAAVYNLLLLVLSVISIYVLHFLQPNSFVSTPSISLSPLPPSPSLFLPLSFPFSQFMKSIQTVSGKDLSHFMEQWVCRSGVPHFHASFSYVRKKNIVELRLKQEMLRGYGKFVVSFFWIVSSLLMYVTLISCGQKRRDIVVNFCFPNGIQHFRFTLLECFSRFLIFVSRFFSFDFSRMAFNMSLLASFPVLPTPAFVSQPWRKASAVRQKLG